MLGSPLDLAWSHILDDIYLKALADWGKDKDLRRLRMLLESALPGKDIEEAMESVDEHLKESYSNRLPDLNSLRRALQTHHLDENGELQTIDPEAEEAPSSLWDTQHLVSQAVTEALQREDRNILQRADTLRDLDSMIATRFAMSIPNHRIKRKSLRGMMGAANAGNIWHRTPHDWEIDNKMSEITQRIEQGLEDSQLLHYGDAEIRREAMKRLTREYRRQNKQRYSLLPALDEVYERDGARGIEKQLRFVVSVLAHAYAYDKADRFIHRGLNPEIDSWRDDYEERIKNTPQFKHRVQRRVGLMHSSFHEGGLLNFSEKVKEAEEAVTREMVQHKLFEKFWHEGVRHAGNSDTFHQAREHVESWYPDYGYDDELSDKQQHDDAFQALSTIATIMRVPPRPGQYAYGTNVPDIDAGNQESAMRRVTRIWDTLGGEAQKILLSLYWEKGPVLGHVLKTGTQPKARKNGMGFRASILPEDALKQFAEHIHEQSARDRRENVEYAVEDDESIDDIETYLTGDSPAFRGGEIEDYVPGEGSGTELKGIKPVAIPWSTRTYKKNELDELMTRATQEGGHEQEGLPMTKKRLIAWMHKEINPSESNHITTPLGEDENTEGLLEHTLAHGLDAAQAMAAIRGFSSYKEGTLKQARDHRRMTRLMKLLLNVDGRVKHYRDVIGSEDFARLRGEDHWDHVRREQKKGGKTLEEQSQFLDQFQAEGDVKCHLCDAEGYDRQNPSMNCPDAPDNCEGAFSDLPDRIGYRKPKVTIQKDTDTNRLFVDSLLGELIGWNDEGKKEPAVRLYTAGPDGKDYKENPDYVPGLLQRVTDADKKMAMESGMMRACPRCDGTGEIGDGDWSVTCRACRAYPYDERTGLKMVPDMAAFYVSRGWGMPYTSSQDKSDVSDLHEANKRIREKLLSVNAPSQEQSEADASLRQGFIPADGVITPFEIHPITSWPALHTEDGALSAKGILKARGMAVEALNKSPQDSMDARVDFVKDFLKDYYRDIFSRISSSMETQTQRSIIESLSPENAVDARFMDELFYLMAAHLPFNGDNPLELPTRELNRVMDHLAHAHSPDYDGRNMLVDNGAIQAYDHEDESTHCTLCNGTGHELDVKGNPLKHRLCWDAATHTGCAGTGSDGLRKMLKRQPWITRAFPLRDIGDLFRKGLLEQELGRIPAHSQNRWLNPKGCSCSTCGGGRSSSYTRTARRGTYDGSGNLLSLPPSRGNNIASSFRADMFLKPGNPRLPVRPPHDEIGANEKKYRELYSLMKQMESIGAGDRTGLYGALPGQRLMTRDESGKLVQGREGTTVQLTAEQIEEKMDELQRALSGEDARDALLQFHSDESIIPKFDEGWKDSPYLVPEGADLDDFDNMPCPYCNRQKALGRLNGDVPTIGEHKENAAAPEFATCPVAEERGDTLEGDLHEMQVQLTKEWNKSEDQLRWERMRDIYAPVWEKMDKHYKGWDDDSSPVDIHTKTGSVLGVGSIVPRSPIVIAHARIAHPATTDTRGRGKFGHRAWSHSSPVTLGNLPALIQHGIESLPVDKHEEHELAKLLALHILDPDYMLHEHGNPLELPLPEVIERKREEGMTNQEMQQWFFQHSDDLWGWARKVLGKGKKEYGITDEERASLDMGFGKLKPVLLLAKQWHDLNTHPETKQLLLESGIDEDILPRSIFSFDPKKGTFLHQGDELDDILALLRVNAMNKLITENDSAYDADSAGFVQPHENNPSMDFFYTGAHLPELVNGALAEAWRQHDDEALREFGDEWVVTGKTLDELTSNRFSEVKGEKLSLMDMLWFAITHGRPMETKDEEWLEGHRFPSLEQIERVKGTYQGLKGNWLKLRNEMFLRSENKELSKQRMKEGSTWRAPFGMNDMGTATKCMACRGHGVHLPGMDDAAYWWSTVNPFQSRVMEDGGDGTWKLGPKEHVPHIAGRKLKTSGIEGHQSHKVRWGHEDSIDWAHEHMTTAHGHEGVDGWHQYFESMKRHGIVPSDWEIFNEDGGYSSNYINWLGTQQAGVGAQCVVCKGTGHCHDCNGEGRSRHQLSNAAQKSVNDIRLLNVIMHAQGVGSDVDENGVWHDDVNRPLWMKPIAEQVYDYHAGKSVGPDFERLIGHEPDGWKRMDDAGNTRFESRYLPVPWETDDGDSGVFGTTEQYDKEKEAYARDFIIRKMMESEDHYLRSQTAKAKNIYSGKMPHIGSWPTSSPDSYNGVDEDFKKWLEEAPKRDINTLHKIVADYHKQASEYRDKGNIDFGKVPERFQVSIEELRERARKLLAGKKFQAPDGKDDIDGNPLLEQILDPFQYGDFPNEEDWRLNEWVAKDPLNITQWAIPSLIDEFQKRTGHKLSGSHGIDELRRLIYADEDQKVHHSDIWPSWVTDEHKEAMQKTGMMYPRDHFTLKKRGHCQHPFCGVGMEENEAKCRNCNGTGKHKVPKTAWDEETNDWKVDGEEEEECLNCEGQGWHPQKLIATHHMSGEGPLRNPYGNFCEHHHHEMIHSLHMGDSPVLKNMRVFGGHETLRQILRHTHLNQEDLEEALAGKTFDEEEGKFTDSSTIGRLGLTFLGFHLIKGTHGNEDYYMPYFEDSHGRRGTGADFGLGHETDRPSLGEAYLPDNMLGHSAFWRPKSSTSDWENRGTKFFDRALWDHGQVANRLPLVKLHGIEELMADSNYQWKKPTGMVSVCPECFRETPNRVEDKSKQGEMHKKQNKRDTYMKTIPNCECGHSFGEWVTSEKTGKLRWEADAPAADRMPIKRLLFSGGAPPEDIYTDPTHVVEAKHRDRLRERLENHRRWGRDLGLIRCNECYNSKTGENTGCTACHGGLALRNTPVTSTDGMRTGIDEHPINHVLRFGGKLLKVDPYDTRKKTEVDKRNFLDVLKSKIFKRDEYGNIEVDSKTKERKYIKGGKNLLAKAERMLDENFRVHILHPGFGTNMTGAGYQPVKRQKLSTPYEVQSLIKEINETLGGENPILHKWKEFEDAMLRINPSTQHAGELGQLRKVGADKKWMLGTEGRKIVKKARDIAAKEVKAKGSVSPQLLKDANLVMLLTEDPTDFDAISSANLSTIFNHVVNSREAGSYVIEKPRSGVHGRQGLLTDRDLTVDGIPHGTGEKFVMNVLNALESGQTGAIVPLLPDFTGEGDVSDIRRWPHPEDPNMEAVQTFGIRPQSYHTLRDEHASRAREKLSEWQSHHFYHGAAQQAASDDEAYDRFTSRTIPAPIPKQGDPLDNVLGPQQVEGDVSEEDFS